MMCKIVFLFLFVLFLTLFGFGFLKMVHAVLPPLTTLAFSRNGMSAGLYFIEESENKTETMWERWLKSVVGVRKKWQ